MQVEEARQLIEYAIANGEWVERATDYSCVTVSGVDYCEPSVFDALEQMRRESMLVMLPHSGSPLSYRDVERFKAAEYLGATSEFVAAGIPRSKSILQAEHQH